MRSLLWLALAAFAVGTEGFMIAGLLPRIAGDTGVTVAQAGYLVTVFGVTYAIGSPIIAVLTGSLERKRLLAGAIAVFAIGNLLAALAPSFATLLAVRALLALAAGTFMPAASAYAATSVAPERRGRAISLVYTGFTLAIVIGVPLGTWIGVAWGWRATFEAVAVLGALAFIGIAVALRRMPGAPALGFAHRLATARLPGVPAILLLTVILLAGVFSTFTYFAPLLRSDLGIGEGEVAYFLLLFGAAAFVGNLGGGYVADRIPARKSLPVIFVVMMVCFAAMALAGHAPRPAAFAMLGGGILAWGVFGWSSLPIQQTRLAAAAPNLVPVVLSLNASAIYIGVAIGSTLGGLVIERASVREVSWIGLAACAAGLLLLALTTQRAQRPEASAAPLPAAAELAGE